MSKKINIKKLGGASVLGAIIAGGLAIGNNAIAQSDAPVFTIDAPTEPVPTRVLVNPSFAYPGGSTQSTWYSLPGYIPGDDSTLQGWFSTHPNSGFANNQASRFRYPNGDIFPRLVEIWGSGFGGVQAPDGDSFAELNAQADSALYQDIVVFSNETIPWTASHRGRQKGDVADVAEVFISDPADWTGATFDGDKLYSAKLSTSNNGSISDISPVLGSLSNNSASKTSIDGGWAKYSDTWEGPATTQEYRFAFQAISTGGGNNTVGNFLDDIQIRLSPIVDFVNPGIEEVDPLEDSTYYLPLRINGQSESESRITVDVSLGGSDYRDYTIGELTSGSGGEVPEGVRIKKLGNGNFRVFVPEGLYDPNNPSNYILVPINFSQVRSFSDQEAIFRVVRVRGGGGENVQNLLIPPSDSGFSTSLETTVTAISYPD